MKNFKKGNKFLFRTKLIFSLIILNIVMFTGVIVPNNSLAISFNNSSGIKLMSTKSKAFEDWENLPDSERKLEFEPQYTELSVKDSMKRSTYNILATSNLTESKYCLDQSKITVKDQGSVGSCWAFATTSMLETNFAKKYDKDPILYSPMHMEYKSYDMYTRDLGVGGNYDVSISYMADGYGPVYEKDLPVGTVYNKETNPKENYYLEDPSKVNTDIPARARLKDSVTFPSISKEYSDNSVTYTNGATAYTDAEVSAIRKKIKEHIKNYGAVVALFYCDMGLVSPESNEIKSDFYNNDTNAYYCNDITMGGEGVNHALTIIGWDDNYERTNFGTGENPVMPVHDGAYIILNSWGDAVHDKGYFYVSYDDVSIETGIRGIQDIEDFTEEPEAAKSYDYIYYYDELGYNLGLSSPSITTLYGANVFEKQNKTKNEYVTEVGVYLPITEGVEIYVNENGENLSDGKLVATYTGPNAVEPGYHVFKLSSPVKITGDKFAIKVKFMSETAAIPLECNLFKNEISKVSTMYDKATSNSNESFVSMDNNEWDDLYNNPEYGPYANTNICIKAFTTLEENLPKIDVTGIKLNKNTLQMEVEDKSNLEATINPDNATDKTVTWKSSDPSIASVSDTGIITALKEGTVTITVTTADGNYTAECKVTVIAKKNTDDDIYKDDDDNNNEGTTSGDSNPSGETNPVNTQNEGQSSNKEETPSVPKDTVQSFNGENKPTVLPQTGLYLSEDLVFTTVMIVFAIGSSILTITLYVKYKKKNIK